MVIVPGVRVMEFQRHLEQRRQELAARSKDLEITMSNLMRIDPSQISAEELASMEAHAEAVRHMLLFAVAAMESAINVSNDLMDRIERSVAA